MPAHDPNMTAAAAAPNTFTSIMASVKVPPLQSTDTIVKKTEVQRRREPRRFGGKKDLKPLQLAKMTRKDGDVGVRSACITRQGRKEQLKDTEAGTVKLPQSAR